MLVRRDPRMAGWFDDVTSAIGGAASTALHTLETVSTAPLQLVGSVANTAIGTAGSVVNTALHTAGGVVGAAGNFATTALHVGGGVVGQGLSTVGGVLQSVKPSGAALPPGALVPPPFSSNTPLIVGGIGVALVLGLLLFSRPRSSAPAPVAA